MVGGFTMPIVVGIIVGLMLVALLLVFVGSLLLFELRVQVESNSRSVLELENQLVEHEGRITDLNGRIKSAAHRVEQATEGRKGR
jgi:hypothetical protein